LRARLLGQVDGELLQRLLLAHGGRRHGTAGLAGLAAGQCAAVAGAQAFLGRAGADLLEVVGQVVDLDALELARDGQHQPLRRFLGLEHADQQVPVRTCASPYISVP
jgi:hypothetical protein